MRRGPALRETPKTGVRQMYSPQTSTSQANSDKSKRRYRTSARTTVLAIPKFLAPALPSVLDVLTACSLRYMPSALSRSSAGIREDCSEQC